MEIHKICKHKHTFHKHHQIFVLMTLMYPDWTHSFLVSLNTMYDVRYLCPHWLCLIVMLILLPSTYKAAIYFGRLQLLQRYK